MKGFLWASPILLAFAVVVWQVALDRLSIVRQVAPDRLSIDNRWGIPAYLVCFLAALGWVAWRLWHRRSSSWMLRLMTGLCVAYVVIAARIDWHFENLGLAELLKDDGIAITEKTVAEVRLAAQAKFALLSVVVSWLVASFFAIIRREVCGDARGVPTSAKRFDDLYVAEQGVLKSQANDKFVVSGDEPWVREQPNDMVGLALSGGGVRSATFNLGLLQGLDRLRLLPMLSYLSTSKEKIIGTESSMSLPTLSLTGVDWGT